MPLGPAAGLVHAALVAGPWLRPEAIQGARAALVAALRSPRGLEGPR